MKVLTESPCPYFRCPRCLHAHLQSVTCVIMPWRHNNKYHACVKRYQVQRDTQCPQEAQASAAAAAEEECPSSPSSVPQASPKGPLLLEITRSFREPSPLALLMQGLPVQDLMKVPRAQRRKVQVPPRQPLPLRALAKIFCPGKPACRWSSC